MSDNHTYDVENSSEDAEIWSMPYTDALPLLMAKYDLNEKDAFGLWYRHQEVKHLADDVEVIGTEEQAERARQRRNAPGVVHRMLFAGRKKTTGSEPEVPDNEE